MKIIKRYLNLITLIYPLLASAGARAEDTAGASALKAWSLGDGVQLRAHDGVLTIEKSGRSLWEAPLTGTGDTVTVSRAGSARGVSLFSITMIGGESSHRVVGYLKGGGVEIIWNAPLEFSGDPGEETATDVRLLDLDGDGRMEIVKGTLFTPVRLCGRSDTPLLFREQWDFNRKKFVPVAGERNLTPSETLTADGSAEPVSIGNLRFLTPRTVSSSTGDDNSPLLLTAPTALTDGRGETGWSEDSGDGTGEFVTFSTLAPTWEITTVGIQTARPEKGAMGANRFAAPDDVIVAFEGASYRLKLDKADGMQWFKLPTPQKSACLSVVLGSSTGKPGVPMSIFEVGVQTEMHHKEGLQRLVALLDDDAQGEQTLQILRTVGQVAFEPLRKQWKTLSSAGKRRAVQFIAEAAPVQGAHLLASFGVTDGRYVEATLLEGLKKSGGRGEKVLGKYLHNKSAPKFKAALHLLETLNSNEAFDVVLATLPKVQKARQRALLKGLSALATQHADRLSRLMTEAARARAANDLPMMFGLLRIAAVNDASAEEAALLAREVFDTAGFEDQYRALRIVGASKVTMSIAFLATVANGENKYLRQLSAKALSQFGEDDTARDTLFSLTADTEPGVQIEAMNALLQFHGPTKKAVLQKGIQSPWPQVRALAVKNAADVPQIRRSLVLKGLNDDRFIVALEALILAAEMPDAELNTPIVDILTQSKNTRVLIRATTAVSKRCQSDKETLDALFELLRLGAKPLADVNEKVVATAAATALGEIGSPAAVEHLKTARQSSNLTTDKAIDAALAAAKGGCAAKYTAP
ncbi:MAG: HEAT repeat domain-containing protein [Deltaproteobacteria bacterium]|nr:HEAT repeat domain-containing protein [Deltaproteobacteria bacterium]